MLEVQVAAGIGAAMAAYVMYWIFSRRKTVKTSYQKEIEEVLTSKAYKVKGRFD